MKLAIQGHPTRGKEVIALLKMLGGVNPFLNNGEVIGNKESNCYYISENTGTKYISWDYIGPEEINEYKIFTLEEFEQKFPYKVGDRVISIYGKFSKISGLIWDEKNNKVRYALEADVDSFYYASELQLYKEETMEEKLMPKIDFNNYCKNKYLLDLGNYEIKEENGKTYAVRKQPKYLKTYEECARLLNTFCGSIEGYNWKRLLSYFQQLLICRDAYWKIAGEELGLGKSWEPDWEDTEQIKFVIFIQRGNIRRTEYILENKILAFPTEEIRDAFYKNFEELIEQCKELL